MGIFGNSSPLDSDVEKATSEKNTSEEWSLIMEICDKVGTSSTNAKDCLRSIVKRLGNPDPHIVIQAITLLDACVSNCGRNFHLEIASRDFETEYRKLLSRVPSPVAQKLKGILKKWSEGEFKTDPQLNLIPSLLSKLKSEGVDFNDITDMPARKKESANRATISSSASSSMQKEQDDIARAIELSLQENKLASPRNTGVGGVAPSATLYPSVSQVTSGGPTQEARKVRALYDFEAAEDNELTFLAGEIIHVTDSSDPNWWKGYNQRGDGLFPANFVTSDLTIETQKVSERKSVQFNESVEVKKIERSDSPDPDEPVEINENKVDRLLSLLHEANPEDSSTDTREMLHLEGEVNRMGPLIDMELERVDRKHARLTQLSADLVDALNLYHTLMREPPHLKQAQGPFPQGAPLSMFNGVPSAIMNMPSMQNYYAQIQHPALGGSSGVMSAVPPPPSGQTVVQQQQHPPQLAHMTQMMQHNSGMSTLHHIHQPISMGGVPQMNVNPVPADASSGPPSYSLQQPAGTGPPSGIYHPGQPGPPHGYVM